MMNTSSRTRWPFTTSQWEELEHQALIFKYMISGMPIPPHLLCVIRRSYDSPLHLHLHPPQLGGWSYYQMGTMKKVDPEPGRCRRTDGKKWRCSKEAYQDSKYCERHMHRGRNRSRKPVEFNNNNTPLPITTTTTTTTTSCSSPNHKTTISVSSSFTANRNSNSNSNSSSSPTVIRSPPLPSESYQFTSYATTGAHYNHNHHHHHHNHHPFLYPTQSSSCSRTADLSRVQENVSSINNTLWESSGVFSEFNKGYRNEREEKPQVNELPFFSETCGNVRNISGTNSLLQVSGQRSSSYHEIGLTSFPKIQSHKHDYLGLNSHANNVDDDEPKKVMHHFFDEWPPCKEERFDSDEDKSSRNVVSSDIKLSIAMPVPSDHFFFARNIEK